MVTFPNCKINIGLNIRQRREDGFHDLETVFFPVPLADILEILPAGGTSPRLTNTGMPSGAAEDNLCLKAYDLLKKDFPRLPDIRMHLHKTIPAGAGLGGGSSDAAFALLLMNKKFELGMDEGQLHDYALQLGSDCPFFLLNKPCLASGRGEILQEISLSLAPYKILIVNPGIHINTREAFSHIIAAPAAKGIQEAITQPIASWKNDLVNDFEKPVFSKYPQIGRIKADLYEAGALYASMTGTGSTVFGIFKKNDVIPYPNEKEYFHRWIEPLA